MLLWIDVSTVANELIEEPFEGLAEMLAGKVAEDWENELLRPP